MGRRAWWLAEVVFSFSTGRPCWRAMLLVHLCWLLVAEENLHTRCSESTGPIPVASRFSYTTIQLCFYTTEQLCFRIFTHCHLSICIHIFCIVQFFKYHKFSQNFEIHPRPALCLSSFSLLQVVHLYQYLLHCAVFTNFPRTLRYTRVLLGAKGFACRPCEICG